MHARGQRSAREDDPLWYKDAIIYELHVRAFCDQSGDGTGDFRGLTEKLDYLQGLGVNTLWLLPFSASPMRDDGYDVSDYRGIHPAYGTRRDCRNFVREAHRRGLKIITELVVNHTSDQHPWFQAARRAPPGSAKREFYVWSDTDKKFPETRIIFTDTEASNWTWDPVAQAYYWHRFFSHQPDLNHNNPDVVKAIIRVMRFWFDLGVDGLRLDAIPYLCVREGTNNENLPETHAVIKQMRAAVDADYEGRVFLAEANQWPEDVRDYFADGDECHMAYHFPLMPRMYMAIAQEDRHPIIEIMEQTPDIPESCQWAIFLRNHDELTLEMVTDRERDYMYQRYASEQHMRVNVGIRRRLAPLLDNDREKIKLMNSLLLSMPGSPIIYYGDEIGMGDNIYLGDRNGVRTPMQWSPDRNAGFSRADPQRLYLPVIMDPVYGYEAVNVEAQSRDPSSLLNWIRRLIAVRQAHNVFGRGTLEFLRPGNRKVLAYLREHGDLSILCVANLSRSAQPVELDLGRFEGRVPVEMLGHTAFPPIGELPYLLTLPGHSFYWFRLAKEAEVPSWHEELPPSIDLSVLVLLDGWNSFFPDRVESTRRESAARICRSLEQEILPRFLQAQRWYAAKGSSIERAEIAERATWSHGADAWLLSVVEPRGVEGEQQAYFLPLTLVWEDDEERVRSLLHFAVSKVRQRARVGLLCDAFTDERFHAAMLDAMRSGRTVPFAGGTLRFSATAAFDQIVGDPSASLEVDRPASEGTNTSVVLGDRLFLKGYRRLQEGLNPELEVGRFLTEAAPFPNIVPVAGSLEYEPADGAPVTLVILQRYIPNQGDGWSYTVDYVERFLDNSLLVGSPEEPAGGPGREPHADYGGMAATLGRRTAELHRALATETGDPAFDPEPVAPADLERWAASVRADVAILDRLADHPAVSEELRSIVERVHSLRPRILERVDTFQAAPVNAVKTRHHGDYHLGQVLVAENDFLIIDFEGEPARPLKERRTKHSALRDVAGMLRSFSYAAHAALLRVSEDRPDTVAPLEPLARDWEQIAAREFLAGYREAIYGCPVYPDEPIQAAHLVDLFTLEKVLYEIRYEIDNRPRWLSIPLRGVLSLFPDETGGDGEEPGPVGP